VPSKLSINAVDVSFASSNSAPGCPGISEEVQDLPRSHKEKINPVIKNAIPLNLLISYEMSNKYTFYL